MTEPHEKPTAVDPPITTLDESCAVFVRNALFPLRRDYAAKQHHQIHIALDALDKFRKQLVSKQGTPFSSLFPRGVMLVPTSSNPSASGSSGGVEMEWNGQPNTNNTTPSTVGVVPDVLTVKCMECNHIIGIDKSLKAYTRVQPRYDGDTKQENQIVICSDRVLQNDYKRQALAGKDAQTLLDERKDLPLKSLQSVEEALAHEITKLQVLGGVDRDDNSNSERTSTITASSKTMPCRQYAEIELLASKVSECMYEQKGYEFRKGSHLRPRIGFSLLPQFVQHNFQNRCILEVTTKDTIREFTINDDNSMKKSDIKKCINDAWKNAKQNGSL